LDYDVGGIELVRGTDASGVGRRGGFFGRRATQQSPFVLYFPGLGDVVFVCTKEGVRDILTAPAALCRAPTPNPIEAVVDVGSLI